MRWKFLGVALLIVVLFAPFRTWTQAETRSVTIHVIDQFGTPIPHAQIRFMPVGGSIQTVLETDEHGNRSLNLEAGSHALSVSSPGFKIWSESIYVPKQDGESSHSQVYSVVLQIGPNGGAFIVYPEATLLVIDNASHAPVALSAADFRNLPHISITVHNGEANRDETYSGVALTTLLAMVNTPIGKAFQEEALSYVLAAGANHFAILSLAEIDPNIHDRQQVLVADARNGQPLIESGPLQLIVPEDTRPVRWVPKLHSISVQTAP